MHKLFFFGIITVALLSCRKEEPFDFSYEANPAREDVFRHIIFDCQDVNGSTSFVGKVDGKSYCLFDTNFTEVSFGMFTLISAPNPTIDLNGDSNAVSTGFKCRIFPKEYKAGNFEFNFTYYSGGLIGYTKEGFFKEFFVPRSNLPLSTFHTTSPPNVEGVEGIRLQLLVYDGSPTKGGIPFTTSDIIQPDDAYVKCLRSEKIGDNYYIELDVNLMLPSRSRYEGEPEPEMKNIKGRLVMQVEL